MARLVVTNRVLADSTFELGAKWTTIGRSDSNGIQLPEQSVSGRHCEVRPQGDDLQVRDLLSTNGTFVNGQRVTEAILKPGQILRLGDLELRYESSAPGTLSGAPFSSKMLVTNSAALTPKPNVEEKPRVAAVVACPETKKFRVLFVDDSMAFLESFGGLCTEYAHGTWEVLTAVSADRALELLQEKPVDLVVLDIAMPMLDGLQLLGIITRRYPGLKVAIMTALATDAHRTDALNKGAEVFLQKSVTPEGLRMAFNVLNNLLVWQQENAVGALRRTGLPEFIQAECNHRRSSLLEIRNAEWHGEIFIDTGAIVHAAVDQLVGEVAFHRLLALSDSEFQAKSFRQPPERTITKRWEFLLMDSVRSREEETSLANNNSEVSPSSPAMSTPSPLADSPDPEFVVVATYDGKWIPSDGSKK